MTLLSDRRPWRILAAPALGAALLLAGCAQHRTPTESVRFVPDDGALAIVVPDQDWLAAWPAWLASCRALTAARHPHQAQWRAPCQAASALQPRDGAAVRDYFSANLDAYRVSALGGDGTERATGLATGYYEPLIEGSRSCSGPFRAPLYGVPQPVPAQSRAELLQSGRLRGSELACVRDPVDAFFLEVQGSGRLRLPDGSQIRLAYGATNDQPYRSIGRWLIEQGELPADGASMSAIRDWAGRHPGRLQELLNQNPRMVFFREVPAGAEGPTGSLGVPLTAGYSVAVDPRFLPLGAPLLVDTADPTGPQTLARLMLAQDTGGAIRGPLRIDWFWGPGPVAGEAAGRQRSPIRLRLLVPRGADPARLL